VRLNFSYSLCQIRFSGADRCFRWNRLLHTNYMRQTGMYTGIKNGAEQNRYADENRMDAWLDGRMHACMHGRKEIGITRRNKLYISK